MQRLVKLGVHGEAQVALVTGAGRGSVAHASRSPLSGMWVVVNDLGTDLDGHGSDGGPAQSVVAEIEAAGGVAIADTTDVASLAGGAAAIGAALDAFGRVDVVVNNAGFAGGGGTVDEPVGAELDALFAVHFTATVGTMSAYSVMRPGLRAHRQHRLGGRADPRFDGGLGYAAAKAGLVGDVARGPARRRLRITVNDLAGRAPA
jgi:NAD(P)-dependent dehydrogenase (short-subunit alcohol dehydrogenase family)